jgi:hypothetical protein
MLIALMRNIESLVEANGDRFFIGLMETFMANLPFFLHADQIITGVKSLLYLELVITPYKETSIQTVKIIRAFDHRLRH